MGEQTVLNIRKNISKGYIFKNYSDLATQLNLDKKTGNSKIAQLKEIQRFLKLKKKGRSFIVEEVYNIPLSKEVLNKTTYINIIEKLVLDTLAKSEDYHISITSNSFIKHFNMVNINYIECKKRKNKLAKYTDIDELTINDFYESTHSMLKRNVTTTLDNLKKKRLVDWYNKLMVCEIVQPEKANISRHIFVENGEQKERYEAKAHLMYKHREATERERQIILGIEYSCCKDLECENIQQVIKKGKYHIFTESIKERTLIHNIAYYYYSYDMIINHKGIKDRQETINKLLLDDIQRCEEEINLNKQIISKVNANTIKRHEKAKLDNKIDKDIVRIRKTNQYIKDIIELGKILLSDDYKDINNEVYKIDMNEQNNISQKDDNIDNMYDFVMSLES